MIKLFCFIVFWILRCWFWNNWLCICFYNVLVLMCWIWIWCWRWWKNDYCCCVFVIVSLLDYCLIRCFWLGLVIICGWRFFGRLGWLEIIKWKILMWCNWMYLYMCYWRFFDFFMLCGGRWMRISIMGCCFVLRFFIEMVNCVNVVVVLLRKLCCYFVCFIGVLVVSIRLIVLVYRLK